MAILILKIFYRKLYSENINALKGKPEFKSDYKNAEQFRKFCQSFCTILLH